jgi:hypothetical protein
MYREITSTLVDCGLAKITAFSGSSRIKLLNKDIAL